MVTIQIAPTPQIAIQIAKPAGLQVKYSFQSTNYRGPCHLRVLSASFGLRIEARVLTGLLLPIVGPNAEPLLRLDKHSTFCTVVQYSIYADNNHEIAKTSSVSPLHMKSELRKRDEAAHQVQISSLFLTFFVIFLGLKFDFFWGVGIGIQSDSNEGVLIVGVS